MAAFVSAMLGHLRGPVIVLWDGGTNHKGPAIREALACYPRLQIEPLPAYSPELNPVEFVWSYVKYSQMANFVPMHLEHLDQVVQTHLQQIKRSPALLKSLWSASRLPFPKSDIT
jgi:hypothetical protein